MLPFVSGIVAALIAPFLMVVGFMIWDDQWTKQNGSPFALNMFKCNLTALWFFIVILSIAHKRKIHHLHSDEDIGVDVVAIKSPFAKVNPWENENVKFLFLSSIVGILIGDWTWIEGLKHLGARKVIVFDSLKPFLAAVAGRIVFDERFEHPISALVGLLLTVAGVAAVGLEQDSGDTQREEIRNFNRNAQSDKENDDAHQGSSHANDDNGISYFGNFMAVSNVVLHTLGATLTKKYGVGMSTFEINFVRFGFSGVCMLVISSAMRWIDANKKCLQQINDNDGDAALLQQPQQQYDSIPVKRVDATISAKNYSSSTTATDQRRPWYALPKLSISSWAAVIAGVAFVSFAHPALTNFAMFRIPLALLLTLESIGPLYSLPLESLKLGVCPTLRASTGAILAVAGIVLLSYQSWTTASSAASNG